MNRNERRKGFTLVELLIVVVLIAILAMRLLLSSDEAVSSAQAAAIIADLKNLRSVALAFYADNVEEIENDKHFNFDDGSDETSNVATNDVFKYMDSASIKKMRVPTSQGGSDQYLKYSFGGKHGKYWFVWCELPADKKLKRKLLAQKNSLGLCAPKTDKSYQHHAYDSQDFTLDSKYVGIFIR